MSDTCAKCNEKISGQFVTVKERKFCTGCFTCCKCSSNIAGKPYVEKEGSMYCEKCYYEAFNPTCAHCEQKIQGQYIEALGAFWCQDHFVCSGCGTNFPDDKFRKHNNKPWCEACYVNEVADVCGACSKPITGECFEAVNKKFHKECFVCTTCKEAIADGEQFFEYEGCLYCPTHFAAKLDYNCATCKKAILGEYIKLGNDKIHKDCWACASCKTALEADGSNVGHNAGGLYLCKKCVTEGVTIAEQKTEGGGASVVPAGEGGAAAAAAGSAASYTVQKPVVCYTLSMLQQPKAKCPPGIEFAKREQYLEDSEFVKLFGMDKAAFGKLPGWRRKQKKQAVGLF
eukprot:CAMPEP_0175146682 /NCGR_PEP_ID=MMETSP0087-20121206/15516_1 /TAXON_ID=136419 /ORGANISM="Unknown Unknown, Strain D1" /LENGTH=342 /DNA_ID=CAMNT_0016431675 /DNA_START=11 /DNA_END=1039 /DNA_ORIENTATION=-